MLNTEAAEIEAMQSKPTNLWLIHKILIVFVLINIVGDIGNVIAWWAVPSMPGLSLYNSYIGTAVNNNNITLIIGSIILLVVAAVYAISLRGLLKKMTWAPLLIIAISIVNRAIAVGLYLFSAAFAFWAVWTILLVVFAYLDICKMKAQPAVAAQ
jgi:hypothetical protein